MKNVYDHHDHQDIYTYNLTGPKRFTLGVPFNSPPLDDYDQKYCGNNEDYEDVEEEK